MQRTRDAHDNLIELGGPKEVGLAFDSCGADGSVSVCSWATTPDDVTRSVRAFVAAREGSN